MCVRVYTRVDPSIGWSIDRPLDPIPSSNPTTHVYMYLYTHTPTHTALSKSGCTRDHTCMHGSIYTHPNTHTPQHTHSSFEEWVHEPRAHGVLSRLRAKLLAAADEGAAADGGSSRCVFYLYIYVCVCMYICMYIHTDTRLHHHSPTPKKTII